MKEKYDCTNDVYEHINRVAYFITLIIDGLMDRRWDHDKSKLVSPEKEMFDEYTPKLKSLVYGSQEYSNALSGIGPALQHHYRNNRHHPEHFENGIDGMTLVDLIEMFCDWVAASEKSSRGNIFDSIQINKDRFNISDQLINIFNNSAIEMDK